VMMSSDEGRAKVSIVWWHASGDGVSIFVCSFKTKEMRLLMLWMLGRP